MRTEFQNTKILGLLCKLHRFVVMQNTAIRVESSQAVGQTALHCTESCPLNRFRYANHKRICSLARKIHCSIKKPTTQVNKFYYETTQAITRAKHLKLVEEVLFKQTAEKTIFKQRSEDSNLIHGRLQNREEYRMLAIVDVCLARGCYRVSNSYC